VVAISTEEANSSLAFRALTLPIDWIAQDLSVTVFGKASCFAIIILTTLLRFSIMLYLLNISNKFS